MPEQRAIAEFLDTETARIDALIAKRRRMILLSEERLSAAVDVVLASDRRVALRRVSNLLPGFTFPSDLFSASNTGARLLRGVNVGIGSLRWEDVVYLDAAGAEYSRYLLRQGDVVLGMDRPFVTGGTRVAIVGEDDARSLLVQRVCRVRATSIMMATIIRSELASRRFLAHVEPDLTGVSVPHLSEAQIGSFSVAALADADASERAEQIVLLEKRRDALVRPLKRQIELLQEHRQALITAAVTGELEVRGVAA